MLKKITSLTVSGALGVSLLFGIGSSASAEEQNDGKISVENREENLVNYLKDVPEKTDINSAIDNYLEEHPVELKVTNTEEAASDSELTSSNTLMMAAAATSSKKKHVYNSYTAKNWTGLTLWKAYVSGWFTYNGTKVTAKEDYSYLKRGNVSVWNISMLKSGGKSISTKTAELY